MLDLKDVTFLIPVRVDQPERLRNLNILIRYLRKYFDTSILVGEAGEKPFNNGEIRTNHLDGYIFVQEDTEYFNRMKVVNELAGLAKTRIIKLSALRSYYPRSGQRQAMLSVRRS